MDLAGQLLEYGYVVVFAWTMVEGETVLLVGGFLAEQGYLAPLPVALLAALGGFVADQSIFHVSRRVGSPMLDRRPALRERTARVLDVARRHEDLLMLSCRFMYGLRVATPVALAVAGASPLRFAVLNGIGALAWGAGYTALGWFAGAAAARFFAALGERVWVLLAVLVLVLPALWLLRRSWLRRRAERLPEPPPDS